MTKPDIVRFDPNATLERWPDFPETEIASGTRASIGHRWIDDKAFGVTAAIWEAEANLGRWMKWPVHEFMIILEGEVVVVEEDRETVIGPGESFFITKGRRCIWNQSGYAKKFMVIFDDQFGTADGSQAIFKIDPAIKLQPSASPAASVLLSPVPVQHAHEYFADATGQLTVGVWDTTAYHVTLFDEKGNAQTFKAGDTFFVPLGNRNAWKCDGYLKKIYCIFQPKVAAAIKAAE